MYIPNGISLKAIGWSVLAVAGVVSGSYYVYNRFVRTSTQVSPLEETIPEERNNVTVMDDHTIEERETVPESLENNPSVLGNMYMGLIGLMLMIIVTIVAIILSFLDTSSNSPHDFRLYSPLMWIGAGIVTASCPSQISNYLSKETTSQDHQEKPKGKDTNGNYARTSYNNERDNLTASPASHNANHHSQNANHHSQNANHHSHNANLPSKTSFPNFSSAQAKNPTKVAENMESCNNTSNKMKVIERAEQLYNELKHDEIYHYLKTEKDKYPNCADLLWRLARAARDAMEKKNDVDKKSLAFEGLEFAKQAVSADEKCSAAHKWLAIMTSETGNFLDTSQKIAGSFVIKEHITRAIELDPKDATSHNILGQWCLAFADMSWIEKKAASALFGTPPTATYTEALSHFENAEDLNPGFWKKNTFLLAQTNLKLKRKDKAKHWAEKTKAIANVTAEDHQVQKDLDALLKKL